MSRPFPAHRSVIGFLAVAGAVCLTAAFLFIGTAAGVRDAAVALLTLAWSAANHVVRSLFRSEESKP